LILGSGFAIAAPLTEQVFTWADLAAAVNGAAGASVTIEVMNDISAPTDGTGNALVVTQGSDITLISYGGSFTIYQTNIDQRHFLINNGTLTLENITLSGDPTITENHAGIALVGPGPAANQLNMQDGSVITNARATRGGGAELVGTGAIVSQLQMTSGSIITGNQGNQGGGVFMVGANALFTMTEATISNNVSNGVAGGLNGGGGVSVTGGSSFTMNSGDITGNTAVTQAGGVQVPASTFNMIDGNIYGNTAGAGGGVFISNQAGQMIMESGRIENNTATSDGGGLSVTASSTFTMTGGIIYNNSANQAGGVNVINPTGSPVPTSFEMQGGVIDNNSAATNGGGVLVWGGAVFNMTDGTISDNEAINGGGVQMQGTGTLFTMEDGTIYGNTSNGTGANNGGGGINIVGGTFTLENGIIQNNFAESNGGGIRRGPAADAFFVMNGGTISDNSANGSGGGVFAQAEIYTSVLAATAYPRITIGYDAIFSNNWAGTGVFQPLDVDAIRNRIQTTYTTLFDHPFNNFDINYIYGPRVLTLTITYLATAYGTFDAPGAPDVRTETIYVDTATFPVFPQLAPQVTAMPGHTFIGWVRYGDPTLTLMDEEMILQFAIRDNTTFIAQYEGIIYNIVTFLWNYTPRYDPIYLYKTIEYGQPVSSPDDPVRPGFIFQGWYLDPEGLLSYDFDLSIEGDLLLYARWTPMPPIDGGGGGGWGPPQTPHHPHPPQIPPELEPAPEPESARYHHSYLIGFTDGTIRPEAHVTRAQVATIFLRLMSDSDRADLWRQTNPYPDVVLEQWFNNAVSTTTNAGMFIGFPDGTFQPNRAITRAELAAAIARMIGVTYNGNPMFNDIAGHWAQAYINAAANNGWVVGYEGIGGRFMPNQPITRAEAAAMINRVFERLPEGPDDLLPGMLTWSDNVNPNVWYYLYLQEASNSHRYVRKADDVHETWVELVPERPWVLLQRPESRPEDIFRTAS